eukprot:GHVR01132919.1.p1 GENE.GHVR01132919.1~~GHVR01132919.1.p1  ORF type:complete len:256 (+),score=103.44 GHVR01132919.1:262-1029(+)
MRGGVHTQDYSLLSWCVRHFGAAFKVLSLLKKHTHTHTHKNTHTQINTNISSKQTHHAITSSGDSNCLSTRANRSGMKRSASDVCLSQHGGAPFGCVSLPTCPSPLSMSTSSTEATLKDNEDARLSVCALPAPLLKSVFATLLSEVMSAWRHTHTHAINTCIRISGDVVRQHYICRRLLKDSVEAVAQELDAFTLSLQAFSIFSAALSSLRKEISSHTRTHTHTHTHKAKMALCVSVHLSYLSTTFWKNYWVASR